MTLLTRPAAYALGVSWDGEAMVRLEVGQAAWPKAARAATRHGGWALGAISPLVNRFFRQTFWDMLPPRRSEGEPLDTKSEELDAGQ
jgi:hypothetical protein